MKKNKKLKICDTTVQPGEIAHLALPLPQQYSCAPLYMPIKVIQGLHEGPCLVTFSTLKGKELNGMEIVNRLNQSITPKELYGTLISIPVVNVYGLTHFPSNLPLGSNLANCFPGNENGSFGERIAHLFTHEILKKADVCIELQTGEINHNILPQVYCNFDNSTSRNLARVFKTPVITNVSLKGNRLRQTTEELHVPLLVYQAGEALRFDESAINLGVEGIKNVMRSLDMLESAPQEEIKPIFSRDEEWILAHTGGILHTNTSLGQIIKSGETIGTISDPFGTGLSESVKSPREGIIVGVNSSPLIHEGLPIFKVASFLDNDRAESVIEAWDQKQPDSYIS